jgi:hypothetical protein
MEGNQTDHDGEPEQERNDPVLVLAMYDDTGDPPSGRVRSLGPQQERFSDLPGEELSNEDVNGQSVLSVQNGRRVPRLLLDFGLGVRRAASSLLIVFGEPAVFLDVTSNMTVLEVRVLRTRLQELADLLIGRSGGVDWCGVVDVSSVRTMVQMLVFVLMRNV